jgi:hypothetical protein
MRPGAVLPATGKLPTLLPPGWHAAFMSTFLLTLANPMTMLSFAAVFAGLGVTPAAVIKGTNSAAAALVVGVFLGSALWWLILSTFIGRVRHFIGANTLMLINRLSGTVLTAFGLYAIASLVLPR